MPDTPGPPAQPQPATFSPALIEQFLANQAREHELRQREIDVQRMRAESERKQVERAHEYSLKALESQAKDRQDERQHNSRNSKLGFWVILLALAGVIYFFGYALYADKDQLILEVVKAVLYAGGGGGLGYAIGRVKRGDQQVPPAPPTSA